MFQTTYRLLAFFEAVETIKGRKKLQKVIHLLKCSGVDFPFKYQYHHYGPYSSQLQSEMNLLTEQGFIKEDSVNPYSYSLLDKGREFKKMLEASGEFSLDLNPNVLHQLLGESPQFLEMLSTYAFLIETGDSPEQAKTKARELKPHLISEIDKAIKTYKGIIVN